MKDKERGSDAAQQLTRRLELEQRVQAAEQEAADGQRQLLAATQDAIASRQQLEESQRQLAAVHSAGSALEMQASFPAVCG